MDKIYRPGLFVHFAGLLLPLFFGFSLFRDIRKSINEGDLATSHIIAGLVFGSFICGLFGVYLVHGLMSFRVTEDGLVHKRLFNARLIPWDEIIEVTSNPWLNFVTLRSDSKKICMISTDGFPNLLVMLHDVVKYSQCIMSKKFWCSLYGDEIYPTEINERGKAWQESFAVNAIFCCGVCEEPFDSAHLTEEHDTAGAPQVIAQEAAVSDWTLTTNHNFFCSECMKRVRE